MLDFLFGMLMGIAAVLVVTLVHIYFWTKGK